MVNSTTNHDFRLFGLMTKGVLVSIAPVLASQSSHGLSTSEYKKCDCRFVF